MYLEVSSNSNKNAFPIFKKVFVIMIKGGLNL